MVFGSVFFSCSNKRAPSVLEQAMNIAIITVIIIILPLTLWRHATAVALLSVLVSVRSFHNCNISSLHNAIQIIQERLHAWVVNENVLGDLQNGFRKQKRLEDNLVSFTRSIEVAQKKGRPLW